MFCEFETTTHGKWILAGEHAVLRGHGALVFPIEEKKLTLKYAPSSTELNAEYAGDRGEDMHLLFWSVLEHGLKLCDQSLNRLTGHFYIDSSIPIGVGMGASAALCVAMARWFKSQGLMIHATIEEFAKQLEHLFHGKSSGLDIAGVSVKEGVYFKQGTMKPLVQHWHPVWYLSSCGQIGITSHCIHQVNELWRMNKSEAERIDLLMDTSVNKARQALEEENLALLGQAISLSASCFKDWGLVSDTLSVHMDFLREQGALAVKPTGSGGGGYVLSLWDKEPCLSSIELIKV